MNYTTTQRTAMSAGAVKFRDFAYFWPRDLDTGATVQFGFWSGIGNYSASVEDADTGAATTRSFIGGGNLLSISPIVYSMGFEAKSLQMTISGIAPAGVSMVRGYDMRRARVDIYRGIFTPGTLAQIDRAPCRLTGFVDGSEITVPEEGGEGGIILTLRQHTAELRRVSTEKRSDASQRLRDANDDFYQHTASVGDWEIVMGRRG